MFLSQRVTVPSLTDSPSAGMEITVPLPLAATGAATGGGVGAATGAAATGAGVLAPACAITANSAPTATV